MADLVIDLDEKWRKADFAASQCNGEKNKINKAVGELVKAKATKEAIAAKKVEVKTLSAEVDARQEKLKKEATEIASARDKALNKIPNLLGTGKNEAPISNDEDKDNEIVSTWGEFKSPNAGSDLPHHELLEKIAGYEADRGRKVAGQRGYFLTGDGLALKDALIALSLDVLRSKGYTSVQTPFSALLSGENAELWPWQELQREWDRVFQ
jgi:seryl-tRNA synthetase